MTSAKIQNVENEASGEDDESTDEDPTESKTQTRTTLTHGNHNMTRHSEFCSHTLKMTIVDGVAQ